jgi:predicted phosphodiesterase
MATVRDLVSTFKKKYEDDAVRFEDLPGLTATWDPKRLVSLFALLKVDPQPGSEQISAIIRVPKGAVSRKSAEMDWTKFEGRLRKLCLLDDVEYDREAADKHRLRMLANSAVKQRRARVNRIAWQQQLVEEVTGSITPIPKPPTFRLRRRSPRTSTPEHMVLLLSDMHVGLDFSNADTGGLNEYNADVFRRRAANLQKGLLEIYGYQSSSVSLPELHVICLGDLVQGSNLGGNWGPAYTRENVIEQARIAEAEVTKMVSTWSRAFDRLTFYGVVGNHGRAGATKNSDKPSVNFETLVYDQLKARLERHNNVRVETSDSWWGQKNINGVEFAWVHGDSMSGSLSSLTKDDLKIQSVLLEKTKKPFQVLCLGHHHNHMIIQRPYGNLIVNGSFVGGDMYSMQELSTTSTPTQILLGVNPKGITFTYPMNLDRERD